MAKVLLVEDDNNLREIYQARLTAEGYDIVAAQDGEEALVSAKKEHPDLIISDVMMPRISGFEMLDILRNTDELKHTKIIMLTALGQAEDQTRADNLGADRYLVKSQVTLEDIVKAAQELLSELPATGAPAPAAAEVATPAVASAATATEPVAAPTPAPEPVAVPEPVAPVSAPVVADTPVVAPAPEPAVEPVVPAAVPEPAVAPVAPEPVAAPTPAPEPVAVPEPVAPVSAPVVAPTEEAEAPAEDAPEPSVEKPDAQSLAEEEAAIENQIESFVEAPAEDAPEVEPSAEAPKTATTEGTEEAANEANDDAVMANAVDELVSSITPTPEAVPPSAVVVSPEASTPEPTEPAAPAKEDTPDVTTAPVAGKKVIAPLSDSAIGPSLDELLAKEVAAEEAATPPAPVVNGAPQPAPAPQPNPVGKTFDPNSISL